MGNNRKLTLEDVRRQSLEKWSQEQRRALNEATKNTPVNDRNAAGSGTGSVAGGSFSDVQTGTEERVFLQFYGDNETGNWAYITYSEATGEWSEIIQTEISTTDYDGFGIYPTNGYGWLIDFSYQPNSDFKRFIYIDNQGEILWDSELVFTNSDWDIDTESRAIGLVSLFIDTGTEFIMHTFYKDVHQQWDFGAYASSSMNMDDAAYGDSFRYSYGTYAEGRTVYMLNALTGSKTTLFVIPPSKDLYIGSWESSIGTAGSSIDTHPNALFYLLLNGDNSIYEAKIVDMSGNVYVDIVAQCSDQEFDLTAASFSTFWDFGSAQRTKSVAGANIALTVNSGSGYFILINPITGVYRLDPLPAGILNIMPGITDYADAFCVLIEPDSGYISQGSMLMPLVSGEQWSIFVVSPDGNQSENTPIDGGIATTMISDSSNTIKTLNLDQGSLSLLVIDGNEPDSGYGLIPLSTSIYNNPSDYFNWINGFSPTGLPEVIFDAYDVDNGDVNGYYLQDTFAPTLIHTGPGGGYSYYTNSFGQRGPVAYGDSITGDLYVIDRVTRTSDEYAVPNTSGFWIDYSVYYQGAESTLVDSQTLDWQVVQQDSSFLQGSIQSGYSINDVFTSEDYIIVQSTPDNVAFYSNIDGSLIQESDVPATFTTRPCNNTATYFIDDSPARTIYMFSGTHQAASPTIQIDGNPGNEYIWNDVYWWNW